MLDALLLDTGMLDAGTPTPVAVSASDYADIQFDGYSLQNDEIITSSIEGWSSPARELSTYRTPRGDGGGMTGAYYRERHVILRGIIKESTQALLEDKLDEFKQRLSTQEGELAIKVNGSTVTVRVTNATLRNSDSMLSGRENFHISFCPFELDFVCSEPLLTDTEDTAQTTESLTSLAYPTALDNTGTYLAPMVAIMIIEAAVGITGVTITNNENGDEITVTDALAAGDVIVIDGQNKSVTVNSVEVDYDGVFPSLEVGVNSLEIDFSGTSIQYTLTTKYRNTYL